MTDLWGFLLQTLYVSLVGGLLLLVKWLLRDKLTPRWQYGVWTVLALRILVPVQTIGKYVLLPLPLWVEMAKLLVESHLHSAYADLYRAVELTAPIPLISAGPTSITDWLFLLYAVGVGVTLVWYLLSYLRLRRLIAGGTPAPDELQAQIERVGETYQLNTCRAVVIPGLPSPMVFGVFRPVLAVPSEGTLNDHVILHEMLHIKHRDALQNVFWCLCRALHWCNPFVHYLMNRIGNDMESLCDQRVLERLEGEERRDYGRSLLAMANDRYARAPGTTSISNGGKNITRRIEAIVRFKQYPKGMALASICVTVVLMCGCLVGTVGKSLEETNSLSSPLALAKAISTAHLTPCTTPAGAIETYAKGLVNQETIWLLSVSPAAERERMQIALQNHETSSYGLYAENQEWLIYPALNDGTPSPNGIRQPVQFNIDSSIHSYCVVYNLLEQEDGSLTGLLTIPLEVVFDCYYNDALTGGILVIPLRVFQEDGFVVEETGERAIYHNPYEITSEILYGSWLLPSLETYEAQGQYGKATAQFQTVHVIESIESTNNTDLLGRPTARQIPDPDAVFSCIRENYTASYIFDENKIEKQSIENLGFLIALRNEDGSLQEIPNVLESMSGSEWGGGSNEDLGVYWTYRPYGTDWDGTLVVSGGSTTDSVQYPAGYAAQVWWNGELRETLVLEVTTDEP